jgi:tRNA-2-methylthio-N6-dimethylallyladenosine synthase
MKKVHIKSFGCQMNKLDTALVVNALRSSGFSLTEDVKEADVVLINTCSVREHAEQRVFSHIGHLKHIRKHNNHLIIGIIGCMAQRLGSELIENCDVDIVCGPAQLPRISELINQAIGKKEHAIAVTEKIRQNAPDDVNEALEDFESNFDSDEERIPNHAFVRAMRGCNYFCSYCIVPYVRGPEISRPPANIIEQIKKLADQGVKVITLLGQTINSYKYTAGDKTYCLADILEMAGNVDGINWIRFVTSYPAKLYFDKICAAMRDLPKVCNYLHIPAQSGSDRILKAMNRKYTAQQYLELLDRARQIVPDIAIAGDFIVGFPGETEDDFQQTIDLTRKAKYKNAFIFKYSPRPTTISEKKLEDNVSLEVKQSRNVRLLEVQDQISNELSQAYLGKKVQVFVEGLSKKSHINPIEGDSNPQLVSRTQTDYIVVFNGPQSLTGSFATVEITKTSPLTLFGKLCD